MKIYYTLTAIIAALIILSSCASAEKTSSLGPEDRALLNEVRNAALEAKQLARQALSEATRARESAQKAADSANTASKKAERIFNESQIK